MIAWVPSNQPVTLQISSDLRDWHNWQTGLPPMTNAPEIDVIFFRALGYPVALSIEKVRLWNTNANHFGG